MKATLLLADYAVVADGKLTIVGGGWSMTGPMPMPFAIALKLEVPWHEALHKHSLRLELVDADGEPVQVPTPQGMRPALIEGGMEASEIPADIKPGTPIDVNLAFMSGPIPTLQPGHRYEWRLTVDGKQREDWFVAFSIRAA